MLQWCYQRFLCLYMIKFCSTLLNLCLPLKHMSSKSIRNTGIFHVHISDLLSNFFIFTLKESYRLHKLQCSNLLATIDLFVYLRVIYIVTHIIDENWSSKFYSLWWINVSRHMISNISFKYFIFHRGCGGLNKNGSYRLPYLNSWSPASGITLRRIRICGLAGECTSLRMDF